ncbi:hypothetical protein DFH07DRAFT_973111 [Mycena maculata]|uniref:Protein kinase domain-containing protein n=1 Tax=Mycena maculata TaxID=230809 RepID=A0AAD7HEF3_9AGAR|nr:hypothetical protein DFH07DRAFT_973111 [Mycena maculata]
MNDDKLRRYRALATQERQDLFTTAYAQLHAWVGSPTDTEPRTCKEALQFCHRIPPMIVGGDSTQTKDMSNAERNCPLHRVALVKDWLDLIVASTDFTASSLNYFQRAQVSEAIKVDRFTPAPEPTERQTDAFHLKFILDPASAIAGIVMGQQLSAEYAVFSDGVTSDLRVYVANNDASNIIVAEDKRGLVWAEHEPALLSLLAQETVPVVGPAENPPPAIRICYQINTQMHKYNVFYAKLFSPCGVFYIRRDAGARFLQFSKVYRELDGEVHRTACLIIEALNHPHGVHLTPVLSVSGLSARLSATWPTRTISAWIRRRALQFFLSMSALCGAPTIAIGPDNYWSLFHPVHHSPPFSSGIFDEFIGAGASGNVWRSADGRHVIKIFTDACRAQAEAKVLASCVDFPGLAVPTFLGLFTDGRQYGIVTPYVGKTIGTISGADASQRQVAQLVQVLRRLHKHGIHHHDVRPENVMVNDNGVVTLIDFDHAQWVDGPCPNCIDSEVITSMERETMDDSGHSLDEPSPSLDDPITPYL